LGLLLLPLRWFNQAYDSSTYWLGGLGRWLRSPGGRTLLGVLGLVLLAGAGVWLLCDLMGWTWIVDSLE
jgi:hypothetical protein